MAAGITVVRDFLLPDLGEGLEDAVIVEWLVSVGDVVAVDQTICTVETAKATVDLPSPYAGRVVERRGEPGETVAVGALLVRIESGAETVELDVPAPPESAPAPEAAPGTAPPVLVGYGPDGGAPAKRRRRRAANGDTRADDGPAAGEATAGDAAGVSWSSAPAPVLAKPPVRKLARELGVDLAALAPGSGPGGRITRADVDRAASRAPVGPATPRESAAAASAGTTIPVTGVRARIAQRMTLSQTTIPAASCSVIVDCRRLVAVRELLRPVASERAGDDVLTPFALMLRLLVVALGERPILNATFDAGEQVIHVHDAIHLGVGTDTERGLVVPVVRDAQAMSTLALATEVRRLVTGARAGTLPPAELVGSTFTVSNFGVFGLDSGRPMINPPEVAILGVGAMRERAVVVDGAVVARPTMELTCTFDHRVCDGADAGHFMNRLRRLVEAPETLLLDA